jgi:cobalamin biosynthesis protein CobD/CbiB
MTTASKHMTRWNLSIAKDTDLTVRTFLAQTGFKKGDLSRFVEDAVRWRVLDQTMQETRQGFSDLSERDTETLAEEALANARTELMAEGRYEAFRPKGA